MITYDNICHKNATNGGGPEKNVYSDMFVNFKDIHGMPSTLTGYLVAGQTSKGKPYVQAVANMKLHEMNDYKYEAALTVIVDGERIYGDILNPNNGWGINEILKSSDSRYLGSSALFLPDYGSVSVEFRLNTYKIRWWEGNTLASPIYFTIPIN